MEAFFEPEIFDIVIDENYYNIYTKDGKHCLELELSLDDHSIEVYSLEKCGSNGTFLLKKLEEYARSVGVKEIKLGDSSSIYTNCIDESGEEISINLPYLKLLTKGQSWYNSLGYFSSHSNAEETERIANLPCVEAIELSKIKKKDIISQFVKIGIYSPDEVKSKIEDVKLQTRRILHRSPRLFPHANLDLSVRDYLLSILPERFEERLEDEIEEKDKCQKYKFINDFINFISVLLNYDTLLTKTLTPPKKAKKTKKAKKAKKARPVTAGGKERVIKFKSKKLRK